MTIPKVSLEARELAASFKPYTGETVAGVHDDKPFVQRVAQFEQLIRSKVIDEAAGVATKARETYAEPTDWDYGAQDACVAIEASIRQLGERGR